MARVSKAIKSPVRKQASSKNVEIRKVTNGFVVSTYDDKTYQNKQFIAKTKKEAQEIGSKLLTS